MKKTLLGLTLLCSINVLGNEASTPLKDFVQIEGVNLDKGFVSCRLDLNEVCSSIDSKYSYAKNYTCKEVTINKKTSLKLKQNFKYSLDQIGLGFLANCYKYSPGGSIVRSNCKSSKDAGIIFSYYDYFNDDTHKMFNYRRTQVGKKLNLLKSIECE
jgi:hypothetical protein